MNKILKIITEEIQSFVEGSYDAQGVADIAYEKFHMYRNNADVDTLARMQQQEEKPYGYVGRKHVAVYLNPRNLNNFDVNVRAISDKDGNLYVSQKNGDFVHGEMGRAIGLIDNSMSLYEEDIDFLLLHRVGKTNYFGFSDTTNRIYSENELSSHILDLLRLVKNKNPQFEFIPLYYQNIGKG